MVIKCHIVRRCDKSYTLQTDTLSIDNKQSAQSLIANLCAKWKLEPADWQFIAIKDDPSSQTVQQKKLLEYASLGEQHVHYNHSIFVWPVDKGRIPSDIVSEARAFKSYIPSHLPITSKNRFKVLSVYAGVKPQTKGRKAKRRRGKKLSLPNRQSKKGNRRNNKNYQRPNNKRKGNRQNPTKVARIQHSCVKKEINQKKSATEYDCEEGISNLTLTAPSKLTPSDQIEGHPQDTVSTALACNESSLNLQLLQTTQTESVGHGTGVHKLFKDLREKYGNDDTEQKESVPPPESVHFSEDEVQSRIDDFDPDLIIVIDPETNCGSSGPQRACYKCADTVTKEFVSKKRFETETHVLRNIIHPNIQMLYGAYYEGDRPVLILELMRLGTLQNFLCRVPEIGYLDKLVMMNDCIKAVEVVHKFGFAHCGVSSNHFYLDGDHRLKLGDFKSSKECTNNEMKLDIWHLGLVLSEIQLARTEYKVLIKEGTEPEIPRMPPKIKIVCAECLRSEPEARPTARDLKYWVEEQINHLDARKGAIYSLQEEVPVYSAPNSIKNAYKQIFNVRQSVIRDDSDYCGSEYDGSEYHGTEVGDSEYGDSDGGSIFTDNSDSESDYGDDFSVNIDIGISNFGLL